MADFTISITSTNNYKVFNNSVSTDTTLTITNYSGQVIGTANVALLHGTNVSFVTPKDGIYFVYIRDLSSNVLGIFIVLEYANILVCLSNKLREILCSCGDNDDCKKYCEERYNMNRMLPVTYLFFNFLNQEYCLNNIYTIIDNTKITQLADIDQVITFLQEVCTECEGDIDGFKGSVSDFVDPSTDCGCPK
jgi:hypothetical protein